MALAERDENFITVRTEYRDRDIIRAVPGSKYDTTRHLWTVPLSWASCLTLRGVFRERLEIGPELSSWAVTHKREFVDPAMAMRGEIDAEGDPDLYPFQRAGVKYLTHTKRAILTDEMGTGKTVQSIRTIAHTFFAGGNPFPALIVGPNNMKQTWLKEIKQWFPNATAVVLEGGRATRLKQINQVASGDAQFLVANYEVLRYHSRLAPYGSVRLKSCTVCDPALRDDPDANPQTKCERCPRELNQITWRSLVADEAHRLKDPKAKQTRAVWALRTAETDVRLPLTGTPIADTPQDMWAALHLIDPDQWPTRSKYVDRWCLQSFNPFGGMTVVGLKPETKDEFFAITDPHVRRMPKALVLSQLPEKVYSERWTPMPPKQRKAYDAMQTDMIARLDDESDSRVVAVNPLTQLTRLIQFASSYAEVDEAEDGTTKVRLADPSCKIDSFIEFLEEVGDKPVVAFAMSAQLIHLTAARLAKHKIGYGMIIGGQTSPERQAQIDAFQGGKFPIMLGTTQAGGVGVTLTRADTFCRLQRSWSNVDNIQAENRVHRIGSEIHNSIQIIDFITPDTVEEGQRLALEAKTDRMQEVVRDKDILRRFIEGTSA